MTELKDVARMADDLFAAQTRVTELELELKAAQGKVRQLQEFDIPEAMDDLEMDELKTKSGLVIKVADKLNAKKLTQVHAQALEWLRQNDQAGLIKTNVAVPFVAGHEDEADALVERLAGEGIAAQKGMEVHHSSLSAALKRMLADGVEIPDFMGAHQRRVASVNPVKK